MALGFSTAKTTSGLSKTQGKCSTAFCRPARLPWRARGEPPGGGPVYSAAEAGVERLVPGRQRVISVWRTGPSRGRTAGKNFFLIFRLYGPEKVFFEKTWKLADVEKVQ